MNFDKKIYYVYALLDPRKPLHCVYGNVEFDHVPFYIGKGHGKRIKDHLSPWYIKNDFNLHKKKIIKKILGTGEKPIIKTIFDGLSEKSAFRREIFLIKTIGRHDLKTGVLVNHSDGGEGTVGRVMTDDMKKKISERRKLEWLRPGYREKMKIALTGRSSWNRGKTGVISEENRKKLADFQRGHISPIRRPIYQFDLNGNFIMEYPFVHMATNKYGEGIRLCLYNKNNTAYNHIWEYKDNCYVGY